MATLVLSTVGSTLGGPIGGALGGLIGQSIDRSLLGAGKGRGPQLGDLSVQSSSYGSPIPRIFGLMRVAGTVVWSTDLIEREVASEAGKGSGGTAQTSYSVSLAVALSSRPIRSVRRIWADGKLIRGRSGDFKVRTQFRLKTGDEDQDIDALIASVETISRTPAYRGIAMAIFEDFELAEFGNRIPMLTFEVVADEDAIAVGDILDDCSKGAIECEESQTVVGFAAYGSSGRDCMQPLVDLFGIDLVDRDGRLTNVVANNWILETQELGCAIEEARAKIEHLRAPASALPSTCTLGFYDPDRDFQAGQMKASAWGAGQREVRTELAAAVPASQAKGLVAQELARRHAKAWAVKLFLPPSRMAISPGDELRVPGIATPLKVDALTINGLVTEVEAHPSAISIPALPAEPGRHVGDQDLVIGRTELALFELPSLGEKEDSQPVICVAGSNTGRWKPVPVEITLGPQRFDGLILSRRAVLGHALSELPGRMPLLFDKLSSVIVQLFNSDQRLLNADAGALAAGANLALLGSELIQFGRAEDIGEGMFRLTSLLRGRFGTEWATRHHLTGEMFLLVDRSAIKTADLPAGSVGAQAVAKALGIGDSVPLPSAGCPVGGEAMRPLSPCHIKLRRVCNTVHASWVSRSRKNWAWYDQVDGQQEPFSERFRVWFSGPGGEIEMDASMPSLALETTAINAEPGQLATLSVAAVGPSALSQKISTSFTI